MAPKDKSETLLAQYIPYTAKVRHLRGSVKKFILGGLNVLLKPDFLKIDVQGSTSSEVSQHVHVKSPGHYVDFEKVKILDREARWFDSLREGSRRRFTSGPTNQFLTRTGPIQTSEFLRPSSDVIDVQSQELVFLDFAEEGCRSNS